MTVFGELHQLGGSTEDDMNKMSVIGHISLKKVQVVWTCKGFHVGAAAGTYAGGGGGAASFFVNGRRRDGQQRQWRRRQLRRRLFWRQWLGFRYGFWVRIYLQIQGR